LLAVGAVGEDAAGDLDALYFGASFADADLGVDAVGVVNLAP
jgi:hypothetical protein